MKYMFISDVHGNVDNLNKAFEAFQREGAEKLILLGDTSSIDRGVNQEISTILNQEKDWIEIIRGNCDTFAFEEMLDMQMLDMDTLYINKKFVTITHGHYYNDRELPPNCGEIFIQGHTHIPKLQKESNRILANPGSITRPRGCDLRCYILIDESSISLKTLEGVMVKTLAL